MSMTRLLAGSLAGASIAAALSFASVSFAAPDAPSAQEPKAIMMVAGKALELKIGDHHAVSYFQPGTGACSLTVVMASSQDKTTEDHGTRIVVPVAPGQFMRIDGTERQTAEFFCGPAGKKMTARLFDRDTYKGGKS